MTIHPHRHSGGRWLLGRNRVLVAVPRFNDCGFRYKFEAYWSEAGWVRGAQRAMEFDTENAAIDYLDNNFNLMANTAANLKPQPSPARSRRRSTTTDTGTARRTKIG